MAQVATVPVSLRSIIRSAHFVRGFKDAQTGKPFNYDYSPNDANGFWQYERGRHFGFVYAGSLKNGNTVLRSAEVAFCKALNENHVI
jgi:hypothetical protein